MASSFSSSSCVTLFFLVAFLVSHFPSCVDSRGGERSCRYAETENHGYEASGRRLLVQEVNQSMEVQDVTRGYMTNHDLEKAMRKVTSRCANISSIYSLGNSVMGIPLWVLEISDRPGQKEPEPAFKASTIINNVHLHLLPTMNPDGFSLKRRGNANNIDLNRDFPDQFFPQNNDEQSRQPETVAIMNWLRENHFTASASLHGGALVANYPWDGSKDLRKQYYACPDDKAFRYMANLYSHFHHNMSQSREFEEGITNGAAWYPIYGGMQDWNYIHGGCFELTLEVSDDKWPKAEELPILWSFNKASMLNLVASVVKTGVHGRIFSAVSGQPLPAAVDIKGINYTVKAGELFGDYHRMLAPGQNYEVTASMPGYFPKTAHFSIEVEAVNVDFILSPVAGESRKLKLLENNCRYGYGSMQKSEMMLMLTGNHLQVSIAAFVILGFLLFLFRRRINFRIPKSKQLVSKRALVT
ncbi:unnamed protein product [Victoria cruziana]